MDIKLRARLSAYALVETFDSTSNGNEQEHPCKFLTPITPEEIDEYLFTTKVVPDVPAPLPSAAASAFIDSLF